MKILETIKNLFVKGKQLIFNEEEQPPDMRLSPGEYDFLYEEMDIENAIGFFNTRKIIEGKEVEIRGVRNEDGFTKVRVFVPNPVAIGVYIVALAIGSLFTFLGLKVIFKGVEKISGSPLSIGFVLIAGYFLVKILKAR